MMLFINNMFFIVIEDKILHENVNFQQLIVVVKTTERRKNQSFTQLFMYFITVNKYRFCISDT